eukprot:GHVS01015490.1.p1 GENE.GHVS01015490.1~~GHVS01015490.1.p1  ORF type:complete len:177 (+),score=37.66 GHVS01015490.1:102-632(+)
MGLSSCVFVVVILVGSCAAVPMREVVRQKPGMEESRDFMERSTVLSDIDADQYGSELTMLLPNNEAWHAIGEERREYLQNPNNGDDLETLLLFSTTDMALRRRDVFDGMTLISLLGVESQVDRTNNRICVLNWSGEPYQCANVVEWDVETDEGIIHVVDKAMMPEELEERFVELGM